MEAAVHTLPRPLGQACDAGGIGSCRSVVQRLADRGGAHRRADRAWIVTRTVPEEAEPLLSQAAREVARQFTRKHATGTLRGVPDSRKASYKVIYFFKNFIHKTHAHHGSSGVILCWKDHFEAVGGFNNELYLRENSDLMKKLRRFGRYKYITSTPDVTSMRRYEKTGVAEMIFLWVW